LLIITVNLILQWRADFWTIRDPLPYIVNVGAIVINIITFVMLEKGLRGFVFTEKVLSVVRMLVLVIIVSLIFAGPLFLLLPTSHVIWVTFFKYSPSVFYIWPICVVLFTLEVLYFKRLRLS
jgi:hypothetical protein